MRSTGLEYLWEQAKEAGLANKEHGFDEYDFWEVMFYAKGFTWDDVEYVIGADIGFNDEDDWVLFLELKDGRYAQVTAGCDYTGWD